MGMVLRKHTSLDHLEYCTLAHQVNSGCAKLLHFAPQQITTILQALKSRDLIGSHLWLARDCVQLELKGNTDKVERMDAIQVLLIKVAELGLRQVANFSFESWEVCLLKESKEVLQPGGFVLLSYGDIWTRVDSKASSIFLSSSGDSVFSQFVRVIHDKFPLGLQTTRQLATKCFEYSLCGLPFEHENAERIDITVVELEFERYLLQYNWQHAFSLGNYRFFTQSADQHRKKRASMATIDFVSRNKMVFIQFPEKTVRRIFQQSFREGKLTEKYGAFHVETPADSPILVDGMSSQVCKLLSIMPTFGYKICSSSGSSLTFKEHRSAHEKDVFAIWISKRKIFLSNAPINVCDTVSSTCRHHFRIIRTERMCAIRYRIRPLLPVSSGVWHTLFAVLHHDLYRSGCEFVTASNAYDLDTPIMFYCVKRKKNKVV